MTVEREITNEASLDNLAAFRSFVEECSRDSNLSVSLTYDLVLAVDEVCTNIITHGYEGTTPGPVTVKFHSDKDKVTITISDKGTRFHPGEAPVPDLEADWLERPIGGLGLFLMGEVADEIKYETDAEKVNHLTVIKRINQATDTGSADEDNSPSPEQAKQEKQ